MPYDEQSFLNGLAAGLTATASHGLNACTITFDPGAGTGQMPVITATVGSYVQLPASTFQPPSDNDYDFYFFKWNVDGVEYNPGTNLRVSGDITATAIYISWRCDPQYLVTDAHTWLGYIKHDNTVSVWDRNYYKQDNGRAIAVFAYRRISAFIGGWAGWYGPVLISTIAKNVMCREDSVEEKEANPARYNSTVGSDYSFTYGGLTWYMNQACRISDGMYSDVLGHNTPLNFLSLPNFYSSNIAIYPDVFDAAHMEIIKTSVRP